MTLRLEAINRFPVKSCRGHALTSAVVEPWGLAGDRRWMVVDADGRFITAREAPRLLLIDPLPTDTGLLFRAPDAEDLLVDVPDRPLVGVQIWRSNLDATPAGPDAARWFSERLERHVQLVYLDDPSRRSPDPAFTASADRVSFADGYPLLVTTTASLTALNDLIAEGANHDEGPLPMDRFRPNLVVAGGEPWDEDGWRRLRVGDAIFRAVKGCPRCAMTLRDHRTTAPGREPIATLARHRRWDGATWFGMNLVPDTPDVTIHVGDEVEVLDAVPAPDGPPR